MQRDTGQHERVACGILQCSERIDLASVINVKMERLFVGQRRGGGKSRTRAGVGVPNGKESVGARRSLNAALCCTGLKYALKLCCSSDRINTAKH
jgi:hypothetical protein